MKTLFGLLLLTLLAVLIFIKCTCYSCLAKGDGFEMPYYDNQQLTYENDSSIVKIFTVSSDSHLPPDEYCGDLGSTSYRKCSGESTLKYVNQVDSLTSIKFDYITDGSWDKVELPVFKYISINNTKIYILQNKVYSPDNTGTVRELASLSVNNEVYTNLFEFSRNSDELRTNDCGYILYSQTYGLLKYGIKRANSIEYWTIKPNK